MPAAISSPANDDEEFHACGLHAWAGTPGVGHSRRRHFIDHHHRHRGLTVRELEQPTGAFFGRPCLITRIRPR